METADLTGGAPENVRHAFRFTGTAGEYFRIWIVNLFLTVITLGVYAAWAKVRTRRYIWANIDLAGHPFTFHGRPVAILRGNLIIAGLFIAYIAVDRFEPTVAGTLVIVFTFVFPFLVCKSLRFNAHNTSYRNIRFHFQGTLRESYETYLLFAGIVPFTLFIFFPAWQFYKKRFFLGNLAYGTTGSSFSGRKGPFYKAYFLAVVLGVLVFIGLSSLAAFGAHRLSAGPAVEWGPLKVLYSLFFTYILGATIVYSLHALVYSMTMNHCWARTRLGEVRFVSTLKARKLLFMRITNMAAIFCSLGLLIPWAKIRRTRYILENLAVVTACGLDRFAASDASETTAVGDAATDFVGIEIGL
ncbi:MAG: Inner membrane protein YjgN [Syntrophorhabdus sp. PtaB.Bin047]|nr:MAG: Inner membrane protein YjgN [Syntrophorhabdus sp. PtaB.Bin047]